MKGLIDIQNENNECFRWCLVRYLNSVEIRIIRNIDRKSVKQRNFNSIKFPLQKKDSANIENKTKISISVFGYKLLCTE